MVPPWRWQGDRDHNVVGDGFESPSAGSSDQLPTAIHVPLGVGIFGGVVALSGSIRRSMMTSTPDRWQGGAEHARTATPS